METTLQVTARISNGKGAARKIRAQGSVPASVYGPAYDARSVAVNPRALVDIFKETQDRNTIINLQVDDDAAVPVMVREVQRQPLTREILHVDFYRVPEDRAIEVMVPLETTGRPAGSLLGGRIRLIRRQVKVSAVFSKIPKSIVIDVSPMEIGDMVKASEVAAPDGVELVFDNDYNIVTLYGKRAVKTEE